MFPKKNGQMKMLKMRNLSGSKDHHCLNNEGFGRQGNKHIKSYIEIKYRVNRIVLNCYGKSIMIVPCV